MGFDAAYVCSCDLSQLGEAEFRVAGGGFIQLYTRPTAVSRMSSASVTGLGSAVAQLTSETQQASAGTERQRSERAVPAALKHHFDAAFDAFYPIDGVTGLPYLDAEISGYTKGHIIKRFKGLAATSTGLAYDIIPGAPTDYVLRKQIQKAARSRRSNWPLSKKWPERKSHVIQLWAATWWGRYYTESVTKGTTAVPPPYLTVEEEQAAMLNSVTPTHATRVPDPPTPPVQKIAFELAGKLDAAGPRVARLEHIMQLTEAKAREVAFDVVTPPDGLSLSPS
eukprot:jgi/Tetstr1/441688/TSEL_029912.t1